MPKKKPASSRKSKVGSSVTPPDKSKESQKKPARENITYGSVTGGNEDIGDQCVSQKAHDQKVTAMTLAKKQRDISISEFFTRNRHLLGFDNPKKALLTSIKEAVDNSIDACEEANILPDVNVIIEQLEQEDRFRIIVEDNGPGIVRSQVPKIFGKLLYGSKFHTLKMSRGQQGIGISAAGMYGQLTTGKPIKITSRTSPRKLAHYYELQIDVRKNEPRISKEGDVEWDSKLGTRVEIELEARYQKGRQSVDDYLEQTAIANPHVQLTYINPEKRRVIFPRVTDTLPQQPKEIKPHPKGVELGMLINMLHSTKSRTLRSFLTSDFSRVSSRVALEICERAGVDGKSRPWRIARDEADKLFRAIQETKIMNPPTDCVAPIGEELILAGLRKQIQADFYTSVTRPPAVYRGNPFQIEAGLAHGGKLPPEGSIRILRYANRVPLQYQQSACAITNAVIGTSWRNYGLHQPGGSLPIGPMLLMVHIASVWVPFTSESKEAIAHYPEIIKEIKLALQECGRKLSVHLSKRRRADEAAKKRSYIELYIPHIGIALKEILDLSAKQEEKVVKTLKDVLERSRRD